MTSLSKRTVEGKVLVLTKISLKMGPKFLSMVSLENYGLVPL